MRIILIMLLMLTLSTAKKVALVIGNSDYGQGFLPNPTKDADLIAQNLKDVGFSVTVKKNLSTVYQMEKAIDDFAGIVKDDDIAVIYYAGHGVQCKGKNYLIPTKATINRGGQLPSKALNLDVVIGAVSDIKLAIIMLDACRNNTYPSCSKSQTRGLVQPKINSAGGMIVSFATAENMEASDGEEHSPYALALSKFMKQKMPIETYFREVGGEVLGSSGQRPMLKNSFYGKFSFGESGGDVPPPPKPTSKWITPKDSVCRANGGTIKLKGICSASIESAKKICYYSEGRVPSIDELNKVIYDCGGIISYHWNSIQSNNNLLNDNYKNCVKNKSFSLFYSYLANSNDSDSMVKTVVFSTATNENKDKKYKFFIKCIK